MLLLLQILPVFVVVAPGPRQKLRCAQNRYFSIAALAIVVWGWTTAVHAQSGLPVVGGRTDEGQESLWKTLTLTSWRQGPSRVEASVHEWGAECGEQPRSASHRGGVKVDVRARPPHVEIAAPEHLLRTDRCWSDNQALRLIEVEARPPVWRTTCATDASDARGERGRYELRLIGGKDSPEHSARGSRPKLVANAVHEYRWRLLGSVCALTVRSHETFVAVPPPLARTAPMASVPPKSPEGPSELVPATKAEDAHVDASERANMPPPTPELAPVDSAEARHPASREHQPPWALLAFLALVGTCVVAWATYRARRRRSARGSARADETKHS